MMPGIAGELAYGPGSLYVERVVMTIPASDWEELSEQFPESTLVFAGAPHVVLALTEEWDDIEAQFPEARLAE